MTGQKMLRLTLAFAAASVQADNCGTWSKGSCASSTATMLFKTNISSLYCKGDIGGGSCLQNCCEMKKICATQSATMSCDAGKVPDVTKAETAAADVTAYKANCCVAAGTCTGFTCSGGWKAKTGAVPSSCSGPTCKKEECCDVATATCAGFKTAFSEDGHILNCNPTPSCGGTDSI